MPQRSFGFRETNGFLLTKSARYYYDADAIREESLDTAGVAYIEPDGSKRYRKSWKDNKKRDPKKDLSSWACKYGSTTHPKGRNKRSVWTVTTKPFKEAHFATFPEDLIEPCVLTTRPDAVILDPFMGAGTVGVVAKRHDRNYIGFELNPEYIEMANKRIFKETRQLSIL